MGGEPQWGRTSRPGEERKESQGSVLLATFGKEKKKKKHNTLIRGDRGDSVCVLTLSSLPPHLPSGPHLLYPWENWETRYHCNYRKKEKKHCLLGGWGRGSAREALLEKKNFYFFSPQILFYFIFPFVWKRSRFATALSQLK